MIDKLENYVTSTNLEIDWRFEDKKEILTGIKILDKLAYELIRDKLFSNNIVEKFTLNRNKFKVFEEKEFKHDYSWTSTRLKEFANRKDEIILIWATGQAILTDLQTFINNWDDFYYPGSDDLFIINSKKDWIVNLTHYECFQFGHGVIIESK